MRTVVLRSLCLLGLLGCSQSIVPAGMPSKPQGAIEAVGPGFIGLEVPKGLRITTDMVGLPVVPKVTSDFTGIAVSNKWWSSLIWAFDGKNPYSKELHAEPLVLRAEAGGLGVSAPQDPELRPREYMYRYARDFVVGLDGLASLDTRVAAYSDWTVTAEWKGAPGSLRATLGHGLPYVYFERTGSADAVVKIEPGKALAIVQQRGAMVAFTVGGRGYALYAPTGARWDRTADGFRSSLSGKRYFSIATLPDLDPQTLSTYFLHAYAFVRDTIVRFTYDEAAAELHTKYTLRTELVDDCRADCGVASSDPIIALFRHQWLHTDSAPLAGTFPSPRGRMKTLAASRFETKMPFFGVLPVLPKATDAGLSHWVSVVADADAADLFPVGLGEKPAHDAYWAGKSFGRLANVANIADQEGQTEARDRLLVAMKNELIDWFDGRAPKQFFYEPRWHSLIGLPASYGSAQELNDHHFHYGYFVQAAATIARFDAAWAKEWAPCIELLLRDVANGDRSVTRFPFLRHMDVYAGHSWANGPAQFAEGNNEEASSEDLNLSTAMILWGAETDRKDLRDLGIFLYLHQVAAAEQYWFDVDREVFPKGFAHGFAAMVWGAGAKYDTWFDQDPVLIAGINLLPFNGGSLYLGHHPAYTRGYFDNVLKASHGQITTWRDYLLMYLATADAARARKLFEEDTLFAPEFGNSMAMTRHWIFNLEQLGRPDTTVRADLPTYSTFVDARGQRTHAAYNPSSNKRTVTFSDGSKLEVPAHALRTDRTH